MAASTPTLSDCIKFLLDNKYKTLIYYDGDVRRNAKVPTQVIKSSGELLSGRTEKIIEVIQTKMENGVRCIVIDITGVASLPSALCALARQYGYFFERYPFDNLSDHVFINCDLKYQVNLLDQDTSDNKIRNYLKERYSLLMNINLQNDSNAEMVQIEKGQLEILEEERAYYKQQVDNTHNMSTLFINDIIDSRDQNTHDDKKVIIEKSQYDKLIKDSASYKRRLENLLRNVSTLSSNDSIDEQEDETMVIKKSKYDQLKQNLEYVKNSMSNLSQSDGRDEQEDETMVIKKSEYDQLQQNLEYVEMNMSNLSQNVGRG